MIRRILKLAATLVVLAASVTSNAEGILDTGSMRLTPLGSGVYVAEPTFAGANGAVILNDTGNIVVDTHGSPASAAALIDAVKTISDQPIRFVINTHWHVDHNAGNEAYRKSFGDNVVFISQHETREEIPTLGRRQYEQMGPYISMPIEEADKQLASGRNGHDVELDASQTSNVRAFRERQVEFAEREDFQFTLPDLTYERSLTLHGSPNIVEVFYLYPAHTKTDSIVYLRDQKILILGDLLTQPILWSWSSFPVDYVQTLRELEKLPAEKIVIGHGEPVLHDKTYLIQVREFLEEIVDFTQRSMASGIAADAAIEAAGSSDGVQQFRRRFVTEEEDAMFDQMVGWTISRAYAELAE
jgi:glyoxylase-like metal-dependent hydrolase (beta-lactamase superfamily II)